jgi:hypothetical protein
VGARLGVVYTSHVRRSRICSLLLRTLALSRIPVAFPYIFPIVSLLDFTDYLPHTRLQSLPSHNMVSEHSSSFLSMLEEVLVLFFLFISRSSLTSSWRRGGVLLPMAVTPPCDPLIARDVEYISPS